MATKNNNLSNFNVNEIPNSKGLKIALVVSIWNNHITENLYKGAKETLLKCGVRTDDIVKFEVPGSFELIFGAKLASKQNFDAIICLGSVIKGETDHFHYVCNAVSIGIKDLNLNIDIPVIFGVLTDNSEEQAINRSGGKFGNKGIEAAISAIKMAHLNN